MPNVTGMDPADALNVSLVLGIPRPYGRHAVVIKPALGRVDLLAIGGAKLASVVWMAGVIKPRASASLKGLTPETTAAINAFLKPYGKVKVYWRTGEPRWLPHNGRASAPIKAPKAPVVPAPPTVAGATTTAIAYDEALSLAPAAVVESREEARAKRVAIAKEAEAPAISIHVAPGATARVETEVTYEGKMPVRKDLTGQWAQVGSVVVPKKTANTLERTWRLRQAGKVAHLKITGPAGTAKTKLAEQFAFTKDVPFLLVEAQGIQTATDWYGSFVPSSTTASGFEWVWNDFGKALLRGTPMVILVDELNRTENERALNGLVGLLAWTARTVQPGMPRALDLAPGIMVLATVNEGVEYVATVEVDAAVNDRFAKGVRLDYPPQAIEPRILRQQVPGLDVETAKRLVRVAGAQRKQRDDDTLFPSHNVISTRTLIAIAEDIVFADATPSEAIWAACESRFSPEDFPALSVLIEGQFGADAAPAASLEDDAEMEALIAALD